MTSQYINDSDTSPNLIIGGGTIGLFMAHELLKRGEKVIIIEAGSENIESFKNNEFVVTGQPHSGSLIGRTKGIGGTSNLWGGQLSEFIPADIENKNNYGQPAWAINWDELKYYYVLAYKKMGFTDLQINDIKERLEETNDQIFIEKFYTNWLKIPNFKQAYWGDIYASKNATVHLQSVVTDLIYENDKCVKIEYIQNNQKKILTRFSTVILTCGTIEISRLLLITAKNQQCPFSDNKYIGKFFQDHLNFKVAKIQGATKHFFTSYSNIMKNGCKLQPKIRINSTDQDNKYLGISGYFSFNNSVTHHLDTFKQFFKAITGKEHVTIKNMFVLILKFIKTLPIAFPLIYRYVKDNRIYIPFNSEVSLNLQTQQISISSSHINISDNEKDDFNRPKAVINWRIDGSEFERIELFCDKINTYFNKHKLGDLIFEDWFINECRNRDGKWVQHATDIYHHAGGTIMSSSKENGVVDSNLKIHGTCNTYVAGASILPTSSYANTGLTSLALAYRLVDHLNKIPL